MPHFNFSTWNCNQNSKEICSCASLTDVERNRVTSEYQKVLRMFNLRG